MKSTSSTQNELNHTSIYNYGIAVFGSKEKFETWLDRESMVLGGVKPKALFDSLQGIQLVTDELGRIDYGIF